MRFSERRENLFAVLLIVFFFLPWVSFFIISFSGLDLTEVFSMQDGLAENGNGEKPLEATLFYLFYLIPLCAGAWLYFALKKDRPVTILAVIAGLVPVLGFVYSLVKIGSGIFDVLSLGAYGTLGCGIGMLLALCGVIKPKPPAA